jgi:hypothetical protein
VTSRTKGRFEVPLTMEQVAARVGWSVERTREHLKRINDEVGGMLLVNAGGSGFGARYTVTLSALRLATPGWFDRDGNMVDLTQRVEVLETRVNHLATQLNAMKVAFFRLAKDVARIPKSTAEHGRARQIEG